MKAMHEESTQEFVGRKQSLEVSPLVFPRKRGVQRREVVTFADVQSAAKLVGETQHHLSRLRIRFRRSLADLPDNNQEELFVVAFKAVDQALAEARERLVVNDVEGCKQYVSTSNVMLISAENKLDRALQQKPERHEA